MKTDTQENIARYNVTGMDCASCAGKIETAARTVRGVEDVKVSTASQIMTLKVSDPSTQLAQVEQAVEGIGYRLSRIGVSENAEGKSEAMPHTTPAYRRALYIVVLLNIGFGVAEIIGGIIAGSQALKADALDFLGDGLITFLGLLAIGWGMAWRARSALLQGYFLGALGIGVLANTVYRVIVLQTPEAGLMGILGAIALVVNIIAALVLLPHRTGDANMRAVWLFSRNDAIGNLAVVIAALLVAWTASPYPDIIVAVIIAGLFLQSALTIIRDARKDLREAAE